MNDLVSAQGSVNPLAMWKQRLRSMAYWAFLLSLPLAAIAIAVIPQVIAARQGQAKSRCNCLLKQLGLALHNYHATYGSFPPAFVLGPDGRPWHSWRVLLLPYMDEPKLYAEYRFDEPWDGPNNIKLLERTPSAYVCPSQPCPADSARAPLLSIGILACGSAPEAAKKGYTSYAAVLGQNCAFRGVQPVSTKDITDGISNTLLIGECTRTKIPWSKPEDIDTALHPKLGDPVGFSSPHVGGLSFLHADGTVRFLNLTLSQTIVDALFTRNGGETNNK